MKLTCFPVDKISDNCSFIGFVRL